MEQHRFILFSRVGKRLVHCGLYRNDVMVKDQSARVNGVF